MLVLWLIFCYIICLLVVLVLMVVVVVVVIFLLFMIGLFCILSNSMLILRFFGGCGGELLG